MNGRGRNSMRIRWITATLALAAAVGTSAAPPPPAATTGAVPNFNNINNNASPPPTLPSRETAHGAVPTFTTPDAPPVTSFSTSPPVIPLKTPPTPVSLPDQQRSATTGAVNQGILHSTPFPPIEAGQPPPGSQANQQQGLNILPPPGTLPVLAGHQAPAPAPSPSFAPGSASIPG